MKFLNIVHCTKPSAHIKKGCGWYVSLETARQVCTWLFDGLPPPDLVLGQKTHGRTPVALKLDLTYPDNSKKKDFLNTLGNAHFGKEDEKYTVDNTVYIDDSPEKSILNYTGNAVFLDSWTTDEKDSYLNSKLQPWLRTLSTTYKVGNLQEYIDRNYIRRSPLCKESYLVGHITRGMSFLQRIQAWNIICQHVKVSF